MADSKKNDADAQFAKAQRAEDGRKAMSEYEAAAEATRAKTERLRALRLARDAAGIPAPAKPGVKKAAGTAKKTATKTAKKGKSVAKSVAQSAATLAEWIENERKDGRS